MAIPQMLTEDERNRVLRRPPPEVLTQTLKSLTGFSTTAEILQHYWNPDRTYLLSGEAIAAITAEWWTFESYEACRDFGVFRGLGQTPIEGEAAIIRAYSTIPDELDFKQAALRDGRHVHYAFSMISVDRSIATNTKQRTPPSVSACQSTSYFLEKAIKLIMIIAREIVRSTPQDASDLAELRRYVEDTIDGGCVNLRFALDDSKLDCSDCAEEYKDYVKAHQEQVRKDILAIFEERD